MKERASDVQARISAVHQLSAVVSAMRAIAAAHAREARGHLDGIRAYAATIAQAIGRALAIPAESAGVDAGSRARRREAIVLFCAEQGFVGRFNERVIAALQPHLAERRGERILLLGDRGLMVAAEQSLTIDWSAPMIAHSGEAEALAARIADQLADLLGHGVINAVRIIHAAPQASVGFQIVDRLLVPFDFRRFPIAATTQPPLVTLPPQALVAQLAQEYVFAELCEAVMLSYAAENEARMRAMVAARANVAKTLDDLTGRYRRLRQEEITSEIVELASGRAAQTGRRARRTQSMS